MAQDQMNGAPNENNNNYATIAFFYESQIPTSFYFELFQMYFIEKNKLVS